MAAVRPEVGRANERSGSNGKDTRAERRYSCLSDSGPGHCFDASMFPQSIQVPTISVHLCGVAEALCDHVIKAGQVLFFADG
jgi:hypothetical protein